LRTIIKPGLRCRVASEATRPYGSADAEGIHNLEDFEMERETKKGAKVDVHKMMETYEKLAKPAEQHKLLAKMAGSWKVTGQWWQDADSAPNQSNGTAKHKVIFDGLFVQQEYTGDMMGNPFVGIGMVGFDNHTKKFQSIWMDSMGSSIMYFVGNTNNGNTITMTADFDDPMRGSVTWRSVTKIVSDDIHTVEMYVTPKNGSEEKMAEMTYNRVR